MTKPTQAQIMREALEGMLKWTDSSFKPVVAARAALTAAAEAGEGTFDDGYKYKEAECKDEIAATIERCAQVARKYIDDLIDPQSKIMSHWDQIKQQCEDYKGSDLPRLNFESLIETIAEDAEAAIRALKDKP